MKTNETNVMNIASNEMELVDFRLYEDKEPLALPMMPVENGVKDIVELQYEGTFSYLGLHGEDFETVERVLVLPEALQAPVEEGQTAGVLEYRLGGEKLGELPVVTAGTVREARLGDYIKKIFLLQLLLQLGQ